jgi:hypothetical protein
MSRQPELVDEGDHGREHRSGYSERLALTPLWDGFQRDDANLCASLAGGDLDPPTLFPPR